LAGPEFRNDQIYWFIQALCPRSNLLNNDPLGIGQAAFAAHRLRVEPALLPDDAGEELDR
jgi:hypothetical protein